MGTIFHDAIVVTAFRDKDIRAAYAMATSIGLDVSEPVASKMNGYRSILIAPDGSKEWWPDSDEGDRRRAQMIAWLETCHGNSEIDVFLQFAAVRYGSDLETAPEVTGGTGFDEEGKVQP